MTFIGFCIMFEPDKIDVEKENDKNRNLSQEWINEFKAFRSPSRFQIAVKGNVGCQSGSKGQYIIAAACYIRTSLNSIFDWQSRIFCKSYHDRKHNGHGADRRGESRKNHTHEHCCQKHLALSFVSISHFGHNHSQIAQKCSLI